MTEQPMHQPTERPTCWTATRTERPWQGLPSAICRAWPTEAIRKELNGSSCDGCARLEPSNAQPRPGIEQLQADLADAEAALWRVMPNTYTVAPPGKADPFEGPGETYRTAYERLEEENTRLRERLSKARLNTKLAYIEGFTRRPLGESTAAEIAWQYSTALAILIEEEEF